MVELQRHPIITQVCLSSVINHHLAELILRHVTDPYHTYLSLASLALYPPDDVHESWILNKLDPLLNATQDTVGWIRKHITL